MTLTATDTLAGGVSVRLPRRPARIARASRPPSSAKRGKVSAFTRKSRARLRRRLQTAKLDWKHTTALTLTFLPTTAPGEARKARDRFVRFMRARLPGCFGFWSLEFKATGAAHYHLLLAADRAAVNAQREALITKWAAIMPGAPGLYCEPAQSLAGYVKYCGKSDAQRIAPAHWLAEGVGKFWGEFGDVAQRAQSAAVVPAVAQDVIRAVVAHLLAEDGTRYSAGFAEAVKQSCADLSVTLTRSQWARLRSALIALARRAQGTQSPRIDARNTRATPPSKSRPLAHSPQRKASIENKSSEVKPHFRTKRTQSPCNPRRHSP